MSFKFSPKKNTETVALSFDFSRLLATDETITAQAVTASSGTVSGEAVSNGVVNFLLAGGSVGEIISITCQITTSGGQAIIETATMRVTI